jgi:hypothetical protein
MQTDPLKSSFEGSTESDRILQTTIDLDKVSMVEAVSTLQRFLQYRPALPERLRSVGVYASELFRESANWLVPAAFRNSRSYSIFVRQMLEYAVHSSSQDSNRSSSYLEQSETDVPQGSQVADEEVFLARKTVSSLLDMAALATFHLSPLTVIAVFSEVAYGWKGHMQQLGIRLKEQRLIPSSTSIDDADQLATALDKAVGSASAVFEKPLLSLEGLRKTIRETQSAVAQTEPNKLLSLAEIDQLQRQMELAARFENASIWDVSATISVFTLNRIQAANCYGIVTLDLTGNIFQHHIIDHYWEGLRAIERHGLLTVLSQSSEPFLETLWNNYSMDQKTWTEMLFSKELLKWGWSQLTWPKLSRGS